MLNLTQNQWLLNTTTLIKPMNEEKEEALVRPSKPSCPKEVCYTI